MNLAPMQPLEQSDRSSASEPSPAMARVSVAEKELGELRALGLAKAISSRGLDASSTHAPMKKEDQELKALKELGLTSAKTKPRNEELGVVESSQPTNKEKVPSKENVSLGETGLVQLRAMGLTKAISSQGMESGSSRMDTKKEDKELKALKELGLTSTKTKLRKDEGLGCAVPLEPIDGERILTEGHVSLAEKELGELRAMGLAKAISSRGLDASSTHTPMKKEDQELKALKELGLTSAKTKPRNEELGVVESSQPTNKEKVPSKENVSLGEKGLVQLRAMGLTKAISSQGMESGSSRMDTKKEDKELKALKELGLTSTKTKLRKDEGLGCAVPLEPIDGERILTEGHVSLAEKELGELRAMGLAKAISSRGLDASSTHTPMKKEDQELKALKELGLTSAKTKPRNEELGVVESSQPTNKEKVPSKENVSLGEKGLVQLRAMGLTKAISSQGMESGSSRMDTKKEDKELKALKELGLTSTKTKLRKDEGLGCAVPLEPIDGERILTEGHVSLAEKELGELRAMGLAKAISSRGLDASSTHAPMKKEDEELKALRGLGLTTAKTRSQRNDSQFKESFTVSGSSDHFAVGEPSLVEEELSLVAKELGTLRARGLTKVVASKGFDREWQPGKRKEEEELKALKILGLTLAKGNPPNHKSEDKEPTAGSLGASDQPIASPTSSMAVGEGPSIHKELGELQALGLTRVVTSKGFESAWKPQEKKEDAELKMLRELSVKSKERFFISA